MREKILLLYQNHDGKALCEAASQVLTQAAVAFGHTFILSAVACHADEESVPDAVLAAVSQTKGVLCGNEDMRCLPDLAAELQCACRVRELRYDHLCENRAVNAPGNALRAVIVQALDSEPARLSQAANMARDMADADDLPLYHVPPTGRLASDWKAAVSSADSPRFIRRAKELPLPDVIPMLIRAPESAGVLLCPPYAGSVVAPAAAALCGAPGMCFDSYQGGSLPIYAPLRQYDGRHGDDSNPFGILRAAHRLLKDALGLQKEADCLEAAVRNVLQAGWRTGDIASADTRGIGMAGITGLICQQLEVVGAWITKN